MRFRDIDAGPRVCLPSGEYSVADISPNSVRFYPYGVPGFLRGQRLTALIAFPGGETVAAVGAIYRINPDGVVMCFDHHLPPGLLSND
jgi:hypothetical protein